MSLAAGSTARAGVPTHRTLPLAEALAWALLAALLVSWKMLPGWTGGVAPDGVQYVSVARNLLDGHGPATSVIYFDAERSLGVLPAPQVTFPPGYSYAIAAVASAGLQVERAALLVSLLAMVGTVFALRWVGAILELSPWLVRGMLAAFALNALSLELAAYVISEPLFTLVATVGVGLLLAALRAQRDPRQALLIAALSGIVFGAAYWVRYSGLFFVVGLAALVAASLVLRRPRVALAAAAAFACAAVLAGAGLLRNESLVGNWRGGNSKAVVNPVFSVVKNSVRTVDDLLFGSAPILENLLPRALFFGLLCIAAWLLWRAARGPARAAGARMLADPRLDAAMAMLILLGTYCAAMVYAGLFTVISYGSRMFAPVLPLAMLLLATLVTIVAGRGLLDGESFSPGRKCLALALLPYAWLNLGWFAAAPITQGPPAAAARFDTAGTAGGMTPRQAIAQLVGTDGVLVATDGPMTAYAIGVSTVALAGTQYTEASWSEPAVREVMGRYRARALAVSAPVPGVDPVDALPSPFLQAVFDGQTPAWLEEVTRTDAVVVLRPRVVPESGG